MSEHSNIYDALAAAQGEFPEIKKDKINPHFQSRYASLDFRHQDPPRAADLREEG